MDILELWRRIAFIDIEASGLMKGAFPVEVAWQTDLGTGEVLINPSGNWDESRWDADAEAMHSLTLAELKRRGRPPRPAASAVEAALKGRTVFTDSPAHDTAWIDMLHAAGGVARTYRIESIGRLMGYLGTRVERAYEIFQESRISHPPRGRARNGVAHLVAVFNAAAAESSR